MWKGVRPALFLIFTLVTSDFPFIFIFFSRISTISLCPWKQASWRGVSPFPSFIVRLISLWSRSDSTASLLPDWQAMWRAVKPYRSLAFTCTYMHGQSLHDCECHPYYIIYTIIFLSLSDMYTSTHSSKRLYIASSPARFPHLFSHALKRSGSLRTTLAHTYVNLFAVSDKILEDFFARCLSLKRGSRATSTIFVPRRLQGTGITLCSRITSLILFSCVRLISSFSRFCWFARLAGMAKIASSKMKWGILLRDSFCFDIYRNGNPM